MKEHQFSPSFAHNQVVNGSSIGASFNGIFKILESQGAAPLSSMPGTSNFSLFPNIQQYEDAMPFRSKNYNVAFEGCTDIVTTARAHLSRGDSFVVGINYYNAGCYTGGNYIYDGPRDISKGVLISGGHAEAVVGFDDDRQYINADGQSSYGAFKMINSWGTLAGEEGFNWISYDAFLGYTSYGCYVMTDRTGYQPNVIASFRITHSNRNDLESFLSVGPVSPPSWSGISSSRRNEMAIDITDVPGQYLPPSSENKWFLRVIDTIKTGDDVGTLDYFAIKYRTQDNVPFKEYKAFDLPMSIPDGVPIKSPFYVYSYITSDTPPNRPPTKPTASIFPSMPKATDSFVVAAGGSVDPDGDVVNYRYAWYKNGVLQPALNTDTIFAGMARKGQIWKCVVTPNDGEIDGPSEEATVNIVNSAPVLTLIGNKFAEEGMTLGFIISANDVDEDALIYTARNLPVGVDFDSANGVFMWTPTYEQQGVYSGIHFEVSDGLAKASEGIAITVKNINRVPVLASIGAKRTENCTLLEFIVVAVDLDGDALILTANNVPEGAKFIDNKNGMAIFSWIPTRAQIGAHNVGFSAEDKNGGTDSEEIVIIVVDSPVAVAGGDQRVDEDKEAYFNANASTDDMGIISYEWDFGDGAPRMSGVSVGHIYAEPGEYTVTLLVKDATDCSDTDTLKITVLDKTAPIAEAGKDKNVDEDKEIVFSADGSSDNSGKIISYEWDFGDGTPRMSGVNVEHVYADPGTYVVMLVVEDTSGNIGADELTVTVKDTTPPSRPKLNYIPELTNKNRQILSGYKDSAASIWIDGEEKVKVDDKVTWSCEVTLPFEGENIFKITSKDEAGNESQPVASRLRLKTKVNFYILYPRKTCLKQSDLVSKQDEIFVIYTVDEEKAECKEKIALKEGLNAITLYAEDVLGNFGEYNLSVVLDTTAPVFVITSHQNGQDISALPVVLEGVVSDEASGIKSVKVNAREAGLSGENFQIELNLSEGINNIAVEAEDNAGNICKTDFLLNYIPARLFGNNIPVRTSYSFSAPEKKKLCEKKLSVEDRNDIEIRNEEHSLVNYSTEEGCKQESIDFDSTQVSDVEEEIMTAEYSFESEPEKKQPREDVDNVYRPVPDMEEEVMPVECPCEREIISVQAEEIENIFFWREYKLKLENGIDEVNLWQLAENCELPFLLKLDGEQGMISGIVWGKGNFVIKLKVFTDNRREVEVSCSLDIN